MILPAAGPGAHNEQRVHYHSAAAKIVEVPAGPAFIRACGPFSCSRAVSYTVGSYVLSYQPSLEFFNYWIFFCAALRQ